MQYLMMLSVVGKVVPVASRFGSWNVGIMTGRLSELLEARVDICCVQDTRWKGGSTRMSGSTSFCGRISGRDPWSVCAGVRRIHRQDS